MIKMIMIMDPASIVAMLASSSGERVSGVADIGGLTAILFTVEFINHTHPLSIRPPLSIAKKWSYFPRSIKRLYDDFDIGISGKDMFTKNIFKALCVINKTV